MDAGDEEDGPVVGARLESLGAGLVGVPAARAGGRLLGGGDLAQELDVAGREQVPAAVDVDDDLTGLDALAGDELVELALFLLDGTG